VLYRDLGRRRLEFRSGIVEAAILLALPVRFWPESKHVAAGWNHFELKSAVLDGGRHGRAERPPDDIRTNTAGQRLAAAAFDGAGNTAVVLHNEIGTACRSKADIQSMALRHVPVGRGFG